MFELPEYTTLTRQWNETLTGKVIKQGCQGNIPHRFVWYNRKPDEFTRLTRGKRVGNARARGRWMFAALDPGYVLVLGECGGKVLLHPAGSKLPDKYHLLLSFEDHSAVTATTQMWGTFELYEKGKELEREYVRDMRTTPAEPEFTFEYLCQLIDKVVEGAKTSAKGLLTQNQLIPGLGNAIAQDILFRAHLHPRHPIDELTKRQRRQLYDAIIKTVEHATRQGGRYDEYDLYGNAGKYIRLMDKNALERPCPDCGGSVEKIQYLGGACYFCPHCQD